MTTAAASESVVDFQASWAELDLPAHVREVLSAAPLVQTPETRHATAGLGAGPVDRRNGLDAWQSR